MFLCFVICLLSFLAAIHTGVGGVTAAVQRPLLAGLGETLDGMQSEMELARKAAARCVRTISLLVTQHTHEHALPFLVPALAFDFALALFRSSSRFRSRSRPRSQCSITISQHPLLISLSLSLSPSLALLPISFSHFTFEPDAHSTTLLKKKWKSSLQGRLRRAQVQSQVGTSRAASSTC